MSRGDGDVYALNVDFAAPPGASNLYEAPACRGEPTIQHELMLREQYRLAGEALLEAPRNRASLHSLRPAVLRWPSRLCRARHP